MAITAADLQIFASLKMTDTTDGGGARGPTVVQDGLVNNLFPPVTDTDRSQGSARLRKVYPSVVSTADDDALFGATVSINEDPTDANIWAALFVHGNAATTRAELVAAIKAGVTLGVVVEGRNASTNPLEQKTSVSAVASTGSIFIQGQYTNLTLWQFAVGDVIALTKDGITTLHLHTADVAYASDGREVTVVPAPADGSYTVRRVLLAAPRPYATVDTGGIATGTAEIDLDSLFVQVVPNNPAAVYPANELGTGIGSEWARHTHGKLRCVFPGDGAVLWHEAETAPAEAANAGTVNTTTDIVQAAAIDANGDEIERLLKDGPAGTTFSVNWATGVVTWVDVSGFAQPVSVRYRIAELVSVQSLDGLTATLASNVSRTYPDGAKLTTVAPLGDLQAGVGVQFSQQAWTKVWSDALIGNAAPALYTGAIALTNEGAESDRFACVFTTSTTFNLISERFGQIATGSTATDFEPLNPITGEPLFTLYAAGWAAPGVGNVFRFNTTGAYGPSWALRTVAPGAASGSDRVVLRMTGSV